MNRTSMHSCKQNIFMPMYVCLYVYVHIMNIIYNKLSFKYKIEFLLARNNESLIFTSKLSNKSEEMLLF